MEDVWGLEAPGSPDDFAYVVQLIAAGDPAHSSSYAVRALFALRWAIGAALGWDDAGERPGSGSFTLRERLPADLRGRPGPEFAAQPFSSLYLLENEFAAEIANRTMHGVLHVGLVAEPNGGHRGQIAVLVKPNGLLGIAYMAAIRPFRHLLVYPPMLAEFERRWRSAADEPAPSRA